MAKCKRYIVDLNNLFHRQLHANKGYIVTSRTGTQFPMGAVLGVIRQLVELTRRSTPDEIVLVLDSPIRWRKNILQSYKETRDVNNAAKQNADSDYAALRDSIPMQMRLVVRFCELVGLHGMGGEFDKESAAKDHPVARAAYLRELEADDVIALLVDHLRDVYPEVNNVIISNDSDFLQLIDDNVSVYNPFSDTLRTANENIDFPTYAYIKALVGDRSDNIKGISGIGEKRADIVLMNFNSAKHKSFITYIQGEINAEKDPARLALLNKVILNIRDVMLNLSLVCLSGQYYRYGLSKGYKASSVFTGMQGPPYALAKANVGTRYGVTLHERSAGTSTSIEQRVKDLRMLFVVAGLSDVDEFKPENAARDVIEEFAALSRRSGMLYRKSAAINAYAPGRIHLA